MSTLHTLCLVMVGLVNFIPVMTIVSGARVEHAYSCLL